MTMTKQSCGMQNVHIQAHYTTFDYFRVTCKKIQAMTLSTRKVKKQIVMKRSFL